MVDNKGWITEVGNYRIFVTMMDNKVCNEVVITKLSVYKWWVTK